MTEIIRPIPEYRIWLVREDGQTVGTIHYYGSRHIHPGYTVTMDGIVIGTAIKSFADARELAVACLP